MMFWLGFISHWLHILLAVTWFGGVVFMFLVVGPALRATGPPAAFDVGANLGPRMTKVMAPVGGFTILFGLLSATVFGPVKSISMLWTSAYGATLGVAFLLAVALAAAGGRTGVLASSLATAALGDRPKILGRIASMTSIMVLGFLLVLLCMVLMRFGL